mgnify:CR=1 FL=1
MNTLQPFQITNGIIRDFSFDVLNPNITNSTDSKVPIVITAADPPVILAQITIDIPEKKTLYGYLQAWDLVQDQI